MKYLNHFEIYVQESKSIAACFDTYRLSDMRLGAALVPDISDDSEKTNNSSDEDDENSEKSSRDDEEDATEEQSTSELSKEKSEQNSLDIDLPK